MGEKKTRDNEYAWHPSCLTDQSLERETFRIKDSQGSSVLGQTDCPRPRFGQIGVIWERDF